jgi:hypothetical protein
LSFLPILGRCVLNHALERAEFQIRRHGTSFAIGSANLVPVYEVPLRVTVVGENAKTVESLRSYLTAAGVDSDVLQQLPDVAMLARLGDALVLFPDDFDTSAVVSALENVQRLRPQLRLLLVTSAPQRYQRRQPSDTAQPPILLPKPAFGWSILDAIRDSVSRNEESLSWRQ